MELLFASAEPLEADAHRILACRTHYSTPVAERILPDGAVQLIFNLGDAPRDDRGATFACHATGASLEPTRIVLSGAVDQLCVRVGIGRASALLGVPAGEVTDRWADLQSLWSAAAPETLARLQDAPQGTARRTLLAQILRERVRRGAPPSATVREAVRRISRTHGSLRVRELASDLGVGERRLQQLFYEEVGLTPKALCRLARFRAVLTRRLADRRRSWVEIALEGGFYDQAHLVNELRAFTGLSPRELDSRGDFALV